MLDAMLAKSKEKIWKIVQFEVRFVSCLQPARRTLAVSCVTHGAPRNDPLPGFVCVCLCAGGVWSAGGKDMRAMGPQGLRSVISFKVQTVRHICAGDSPTSAPGAPAAPARLAPSLACGAATLRARRRGSERTAHFTCRTSHSVHLSAVVISTLNV